MKASIIIKTDLLAAVAGWAYAADKTRAHLSTVLFKDDEMIACDGHRLVRVKCDCNGLVLLVKREHVMSAVKVQAVTGPGGASVCTRYDGPAVVLTRSDDSKGGITVSINCGHLVVSGKSIDPSEYPPFNQVMPKVTPKQPPSPDGYAFDPKYLGAIHEVTKTMGDEDARFVKCVAWSSVDKQGIRDAMLFESCNGDAQFVVMPARE